MYRGSDEFGAGVGVESGRTIVNQVQGGSRARQIGSGSGVGPMGATGMVQHNRVQAEHGNFRRQNFVQHDSPSQASNQFQQRQQQQQHRVESQHHVVNQDYQNGQYPSHSRYSSSSTQPNPSSPHIVSTISEHGIRGGAEVSAKVLVPEF
ncbi:hypothetical protein JCM5350_007127 [Sporobolomyces pararoseus]